MMMDRRKTSGEHIIDMNGLANSMTIEHSEGYTNIGMSAENTAFPLIPIIKQHIRAKQNSIYGPSIISIGPYHHRAPAVQSMQQMKYECLNFLLSMNREKQLADYIEAMKGTEQQARSYYEDDINMESDEFLKMLLLDGCFLLVSLFGNSDITTPAKEVLQVDFNMHQDEAEIDIEKKTDDIISNEVYPNQNIQNTIAPESNDQDAHTRMWYSHFFANDLVILDNQIPFCVVQRINELFVGEKCPTLFSRKSATKFMESIIKCNQKEIMASEEEMISHHLLHLCHNYLRPTQKVSQRTNQLDLGSGSISWVKNQENLQKSPWRRATEYHQAGVILAKREPSADNAGSLLDIIFCNDTLEIPCLTIVHTTTECLLQNLVAFEMSCPQFGNHITAYVLFWSQFISMPEDVEILTEKGIIEQQVNSDAEILNIFKSLSEDVCFGFNCDHYLKPLSYTLEAHYQRRRSKLKALLGSINLKRRSKCEIHQPLRPSV